MSNDDKLIYLISTAQHLLKNHLKNELIKENVVITPSHTTILFTLQKHGPQTMNSLSKLLFVKNSTVTGLVDRMENNGFVSRNAVGSDRRKWDIAITDEGLQEITKATSIVKTINDKIKEGCTERDIESVKKVLTLFYSKFGGTTENDRKNQVGHTGTG